MIEEFRDINRSDRRAFESRPCVGGRLLDEDIGVVRVVPPMHVVYAFVASALKDYVIDAPWVRQHDVSVFKDGVVYVQTFEGEIHRTRYRSLNRLMSGLKRDSFLHAHRSVVVNLTAIRKFHDHFKVDVQLKSRMESLYPSRRAMRLLLKAFDL